MVNTSSAPILSDEAAMQRALDEARKAGERGEVPVGAVMVGRGGEILATDGNRNIELNDPSAHAELVALRKVCTDIGNYRLLPGTTLYVTLEPCPMCAAAMVHARLGRLVFGATDPKGGGVISRYEIGVDNRLNHCFAVQGGVLAEECGGILKEFFKARRKDG